MESEDIRGTLCLSVDCDPQAGGLAPAHPGTTSVGTAKIQHKTFKVQALTIARRVQTSTNQYALC